MWQVPARRRGLRERNRKAGDEQGTAPDGSIAPVRSLAATDCVASERAGAQPAAGVDVAIRPQPSGPKRIPCGSAKLAGLPVSVVGLTTRRDGKPEGGHGHDIVYKRPHG